MSTAPHTHAQSGSTPTAPGRTKKPKAKDPKRDGAAQGGGGERARLKSIVRRLPPNLPEDVFWGSVAPWVTRESVVWKVYYPGKPKKRVGKESVLSRAYIAFRSEEQLVLFGREFDGHLFRDKSGNEYQAVVEYAPYQKVPSEKKKVDARSNTIEKDEDYLSFIASLKAAETAEPPSLEALLAAAQPQPAPKTTPLLEALKAEKTAQKDKEAILRSHAHYKDKDPTILAAPPRVGATESKKKGAKPAPAPAPAPALAPTAAETSSAAKKGKRTAQPQAKGPPQPQQQGKVAPAKSGKAPRPPKAAKPPKQSATVTAPIVTVAAPPTAPPAGTASQDAAPRRTRPVLGLGSRHFEAALSGVGGGTRARKEGASEEGRRGRGRGGHL